MTMVGSSPEAAARALRAALQRLISCVSIDVLVSETDGLLTSASITTRLNRRGGGHVALNLRHGAALVSDGSRPARERWMERTATYFYTLDDARGREVIGYHWHPTGRSHITVPHVHLGAGAGALVPELSKAHLLTGHIGPTALLFLAIEQFDVVPRRNDWVRLFARAESDLLGEKGTGVEVTLLRYAPA